MTSNHDYKALEEQLNALDITMDKLCKEWRSIIIILTQTPEGEKVLEKHYKKKLILGDINLKDIGLQKQKEKKEKIDSTILLG